MTLAIKSEPLPLRQEADGVVRVGDTRVTLDVVVGAFARGATAEQIVQQYPAVDLADVYAVVGFYLNHRAEVDAYLVERQHEAHALRAEVEANQDVHGIRERLLAQRAGGRASVGS